MTRSLSLHRTAKRLRIEFAPYPLDPRIGVLREHVKPGNNRPGGLTCEVRAEAD